MYILPPFSEAYATLFVGRCRQCAELEFAINSMFAWYQNSAKCYVYFADISIPQYEARTSSRLEILKGSRWFTRGWTLQELVAPTIVEFFTSDSYFLGSKATLASHLSVLTRILEPALRGSSLSVFPIDERFTWIEGRRTKRREDMAYCLLGIMGVRMRLDYGEKKEAAFARLRKKIKKAKSSQPQDYLGNEMRYIQSKGNSIVTIIGSCFAVVVTTHRSILSTLSDCMWIMRTLREHRDNIFMPLTGRFGRRLVVKHLSAAALATAFYFCAHYLDLYDRSTKFHLLSHFASLLFAMSILDPPKAFLRWKVYYIVDAIIFVLTFCLAGFIVIGFALFLQSIGIVDESDRGYRFLLFLVFTQCGLCTFYLHITVKEIRHVSPE